MEKIYQIFVLLILALQLTSCEDFLTKSPKGVLSSGSFYESSEQARQAVNAAYDILQNFYGYNAGDIHSDIMSDDSEKGGGGPGDFAALLEISNYEVSTANSVVESVWENSYAGIYKCNIGLERIPDINMDNDLQQRLISELKFLRALYYYRLQIRWNGVPLVKSTNIDSTKTSPRSSGAETWAFIENNLEDAIKGLPAQYMGPDVGRATKGSAQALLGSVYLFQQKWQSASDTYASIISSGNYHLMDDYFANFENKSGDNLPESLFEVQFKSGTEDLLANGFGRSHWIRPRTGEIEWSGIGFSLPTQDLADEFEDGDPRKHMTLLSEGEEIFGTNYKEEWSNTGHNARKYLFGPSIGGNPEALDANFKVIRYSEVLLGYAEAQFNLGNTSEALMNLNKVRDRVGMPVLNSISFDDIVHERRVELALEGKRFFDLVRWDIAGDVLRSKGYNFDSGQDEYWPIPQSQLDLNPNLEQNPGYN